MTEEQIKKMRENFYPVWAGYESLTCDEFFNEIIEWMEPHLEIVEEENDR